MAYLLGFFIFMIVFMIIAIKTRQMRWYIIGAIFQLAALLGEMMDFRLNEEETIVKWIIYFAILLITMIIIKFRRKSNSN